MGWSYRRSVKIMPGVRMNLSKSGVGFSYGGRGGRITKSPDGRETFSASIPGTGLRYRKTIKSADRKTSRNTYVKPKASVPPSMLRVLFVINTLIFVVCIFVLFSKPVPGDGPKSDLIPVFLINALIYFVIRVISTSKKPIQEEKIDEETFLTSRFNRDPENVQEWEATVHDYKVLVDCIEKSVEEISDNSNAPEFPVTKGEVVLFKIFGASTNEAMTQTEGGVIYITNKKITFLGTNRNKEWLFSKMTSFLPYDKKCVILFQNIDQKTVRGICIPERTDFFRFQFYLVTAYSLNKYEPQEVLRQFKESFTKYKEAKPKGGSGAIEK